MFNENMRSSYKRALERHLGKLTITNFSYIVSAIPLFPPPSFLLPPLINHGTNKNNRAF